MAGGWIPTIETAQHAANAQQSAALAQARHLSAVAPDEARRAAEEFEAVFLAQMLAPMFEGLETDELFGGGPGEDIYRSLLVEEYGRRLAQAGGVGLADAVQREILRLQEVK